MLFLQRRHVDGELARVDAEGGLIAPSSTVNIEFMSRDESSFAPSSSSAKVFPLMTSVSGWASWSWTIGVAAAFFDEVAGERGRVVNAHGKKPSLWPRVWPSRCPR